MQNTINYFYNLFPNEIMTNKDELSFILDYEYYYFIPFERNIKDITNVLSLNDELHKLGYHSHTIIKNINDDYATKFDNKSYVLLKTNEYELKEISFKEILLINNRINFDKNNIKKWSDLWIKKIDYLEYQVKELGFDKKIITNSFSYYLGLAENAISYYNNTINSVKDESKVTIAHRRLECPIIAKDYYNPINLIIDYEMRDVAEYIKSSFFNNTYNIKYLNNLYNLRNITEFESRILFSRLLYPSYYFDIYEKIIDGSKSENELLRIIDRVDEYEDFLSDIYHYLNKKNPIPLVDWIIMKH